MKHGAPGRRPSAGGHPRHGRVHNFVLQGVQVRIAEKGEAEQGAELSGIQSPVV